MAAPHLPSETSLSKVKARAAALLARAACDPGLGAVLPGHAADWAKPGEAVAGFWPLPGEMDTRPLLLSWHERGCAVLLPRTGRLGTALTFHRWVPGETMVPGSFGTESPAGPAVRPDAVLVPLLAYDGAGRRLGYGGGFYDRTLATLGAELPGVRAMGCGFAAQRVPCVPVEPHDIRLPAVLTELGVERFRDEARDEAWDKARNEAGEEL